jgi:hypothetical protein
MELPGDPQRLAQGYFHGPKKFELLVHRLVVDAIPAFTLLGCRSCVIQGSIGIRRYADQQRQHGCEQLLL